MSIYTGDVRDSDGTIEGCVVETYYHQVESAHRHGEDPNTVCIRFDAGPVDGEIRLTVEQLRALLAQIESATE